MANAKSIELQFDFVLYDKLAQLRPSVTSNSPLDPGHLATRMAKWDILGGPTNCRILAPIVFQWNLRKTNPISFIEVDSELDTLQREK
jgi:hypothetical protein